MTMTSTRRSTRLCASSALVLLVFGLSWCFNVIPGPEKRHKERAAYNHMNAHVLGTRRLLGHEFRADNSNFVDKECSYVHNINLTAQCEFVKNADSCQQDEGFINYNTVLYCHFQNVLAVGVIIFILWCLVIFVGLAVAADDFFCPSLVVIAKTLRLPDNITVLEYFVTTVVPGSIAMVKSFHAMERPFLRDIIFYIASVFYAFTIMYYGKINTLQAVGFILLYVLYVIVVVVGRYIYQRHKRKQLQQAKSNGQIQDSVEEIEDDGKAVTITRQSPMSQLSADQQEDSKDLADESTPLLNPPDKESGNVWKDFLHAINPINTEEWRYMRLHSKVFEVFKAPVYLVFLLTVSVVDYEKEPGHNWNRYLNVLQVAISPTIGALLFKHQVFMMRINGVFPIWAIILLVSCAVAVLVFFTSKNEEPPVYHPVFAFLGFLMAMVWIEIIANELVNIMGTLGVVLNISSAILGLTVLAWGNSIGDLVTDIAMAKQGYPRAGISACFGGPLFNLLLGVGIPFTIVSIRSGGVYMIKFQLIQIVLASGLALSLIVNLIMLVAIKFNISRIYGAVLFCVYGIFLTVALLVETGVIKAPHLHR